MQPQIQRMNRMGQQSNKIRHGAVHLDTYTHTQSTAFRNVLNSVPWQVPFTSQCNFIWRTGAHVFQELL